jgi:hypothetical protein
VIIATTESKAMRLGLAILQRNVSREGGV